MLKSGEKAISTTVQRTSRGLVLRVQLHPVVEDFIKNSSNGDFTPVKMFGRKWTPCDDLCVYDIPSSMLGIVGVDGELSYRLDKPGWDLFTTDERTGRKVINMSFLRLVGASQPDGVAFSVGGVYERSDVTWIASAINDAGKAIYTQYIRPMTISVSNVVAERFEASGDTTGAQVI